VGRHRFERGPAGRPQQLEARELQLRRNAGLGRGVDQRATVADDRLCRELGSGAPPVRLRRMAGPQRPRIGVETQDDLRPARGDVGVEGVAEGALRGQ
jgi:hypothetical protein